MGRAASPFAAFRSLENRARTGVHPPTAIGHSSVGVIQNIFGTRAACFRRRSTIRVRTPAPTARWPHLQSRRSLVRHLPCTQTTYSRCRRPETACEYRAPRAIACGPDCWSVCLWSHAWSGWYPDANPGNETGDQFFPTLRGLTRVAVHLKQGSRSGAYPAHPSCAGYARPSAVRRCPWAD
jgi:hypothetical protein